MRARQLRARILAVRERALAVVLALLCALGGFVSRADPDAQGLAPTGEEIDADRELATALLGARSPAEQAARCFDILWGPRRHVESLRAAAMRRLQLTDAPIVATLFASHIEDLPPDGKIELMGLMADRYRSLGGVDSRLDEMLADQIRSPDLSVASAAIQIAMKIGLREAYIPLRELASAPAAPLRLEAIQGLAQLADPRAVTFFKKLLDSASAPRDEVYRGLGRIGRPASLFLKTKLDDRDPAERLRALDALLAMASAEDLSALYTYIDKHPPQGDLKKRVYETIAVIESSQPN